VTKLNLPGIEIFSAGSIDETASGVEVVRYENASQEVYKKLLLKENRLLGVILAGDTSDQDLYLDWLRAAADLGALRRHLLFPRSAEDAGLGAELTPSTAGN
jgi:nitrite reductase (NADH) large subunit